MGFVNPPPFGAAGDYSESPNYSLGSSVTLEWQGAPEFADLWLFQDGNGYNCTDLNLAQTFCYKILPSFHNMSSFAWLAQTYDSDYPTQGSWFYFSIREPNNGASRMLSHYFNLFEGPSIPTTTVSTSATSTTSTPLSKSASISNSTFASTSALTSVSSSSSPSQRAELQNSSGLNNGTKIAIGCSIGIGVIVVAILIVIAFLLYRNRGRKTTRSDVPPRYPSELAPHQVYEKRTQVSELAGY